MELAEKIYEDLKSHGVDVLFDDRQERAGVKFKDCDLIGFPMRLTVSAKSFENNTVELKIRSTEEIIELSQDNYLNRVQKILDIL